MKNIIEIWKPIPGYSARYWASNFGKIKSVKKLSNGCIKEKILKEFTDCDGYKKVCLYLTPTIHIAPTVHRLVALTFLPNKENKPQINHKNFTRNDNRVENIEWCTHKENHLHCTNAGRRPFGEKNGLARLNKFKVQRIRLIKEIFPKINGKKVAPMFGVHFSSIYKVWRKETWKHKLELN